jgi:menaquinone-9 beta-reductase
VSRKLHRVSGPGLALSGDASGSIDAIAGEGLGLSFRQALALARALKGGNISGYERSHRALARKPSFMASVMLGLAKHQRLRRRALVSLAHYPDIFSRLLAFHVGQSSFIDLCSLRLLDFGLGLLAG